MFYVDVIKSENRNYRYVGLTNNINRRIKQHQAGRERTTTTYRPFKILLVEECSSRIESRKREKYLKSGAGKEYIKQKFE